MIAVEGVQKRFPGVEALNDVSLFVNKGSIYGLVGSNGAGKTTLLKLLAGIYLQDAGRILIEDQEIFENETVKARTIFIPDLPYYYNNYSIEDMARFFGRIYPRWNRQRYEKLSSVFNIPVKRRIKTLSKGMQRQVAFWMGLALTPEVMILDEPLDGLDPVMRQKVKNLLIQDVAERDMTIMISSHNLRELEDICDYIGILHQGEMLVQKELDELKTDVHKIQVAFKDNMPPVLEDIPVLYHERRGSVLTMIARGAQEEVIRRMQSYNPAILDILPLTLEEIFIYEMGDKGYEIKNILY